jgi:hypothetical protein
MGEQKGLSFIIIPPLKPMKQGVHHTMALPFALKSILSRQKKKNYGNSNISPCKKYNNKKIL